LTSNSATATADCWLYVYVGKVMVNAELVRLGYAQVATYPPNVRHQDLFLRLQREAREARRGLWGTR
jgi:micrococcal nuclease